MDQIHLIRIHIETRYEPSYSDVSRQKYVFKYKILIQNDSDQTVQLISRHWIITDGDAKVEEVRGDGVVGEQPILIAGASHEYHSFCLLKTSVGCMEGSFQMKGEDGLYFDAPIAPFGLAIPGILN